MHPFSESGLTRTKDNMLLMSSTMTGIPFNSRVLVTI